MENKISIRFVGGFLGVLLLIFILYLWFSAYSHTKHLMVTHPVIEVHSKQEMIFNLLEGSYLLNIGAKELPVEEIGFPFSVSGAIVTSSENFHFERTFLPLNNHEQYVSTSFHVDERGKVAIICNVSMPEGERVYLHLHGII